MESKICTGCFIEKKSVEFFQDTRRENGRMAMCKKCKMFRSTEWRKHNRERWNAYVVKNNSRPEKKEKRRMQRQCPRAKEAARALELSARVREVRRMWRAKNKDRCQVYSQNNSRRRRALTKGKKINPNDWIKLKEENNQQCFYCRRKARLTMDHVRPLCKGGDHSIENIVPACRTCNNAKHAKDFEEFSSGL